MQTQHDGLREYRTQGQRCEMVLEEYFNSLQNTGLLPREQTFEEWEGVDGPLICVSYVEKQGSGYMRFFQFPAFNAHVDPSVGFLLMEYRQAFQAKMLEQGDSGDGFNAERVIVPDLLVSLLFYRLALYAFDTHRTLRDRQKAIKGLHYFYAALIKCDFSDFWEYGVIAESEQAWFCEEKYAQYFERLGDFAHVQLGSILSEELQEQPFQRRTLGELIGVDHNHEEVGYIKDHLGAVSYAINLQMRTFFGGEAEAALEDEGALVPLPAEGERGLLRWTLVQKAQVESLERESQGTPREAFKIKRLEQLYKLTNYTEYLERLFDKLRICVAIGGWTLFTARQLNIHDFSRLLSDYAVLIEESLTLVGREAILEDLEKDRFKTYGRAAELLGADFRQEAERILILSRQEKRVEEKLSALNEHAQGLLGMQEGLSGYILINPLYKQWLHPEEAERVAAASFAERERQIIIENEQRDLGCHFVEGDESQERQDLVGESFQERAAIEHHFARARVETEEAFVRQELAREAENVLPGMDAMMAQSKGEAIARSIARLGMQEQDVRNRLEHETLHVRAAMALETFVEKEEEILRQALIDNEPRNLERHLVEGDESHTRQSMEGEFYGVRAEMVEVEEASSRRALEKQQEIRAYAKKAIGAKSKRDALEHEREAMEKAIEGLPPFPKCPDGTFFDSSQKEKRVSILRIKDLSYRALAGLYGQYLAGMQMTSSFAPMSFQDYLGEGVEAILHIDCTSVGTAQQTIKIVADYAKKKTRVVFFGYKGEEEPRKVLEAVLRDVGIHWIQALEFRDLNVNETSFIVIGNLLKEHSTHLFLQELSFCFSSESVVSSTDIAKSLESLKTLKNTEGTYFYRNIVLSGIPNGAGALFASALRKDCASDAQCLEDAGGVNLVDVDGAVAIEEIFRFMNAVVSSDITEEILVSPQKLKAWFAEKNRRVTYDGIYKIFMKSQEDIPKEILRSAASHSPYKTGGATGLFFGAILSFFFAPVIIPVACAVGGGATAWSIRCDYKKTRHNHLIKSCADLKKTLTVRGSMYMNRVTLDGIGLSSLSGLALLLLDGYLWINKLSIRDMKDGEIRLEADRQDLLQGLSAKPLEEVMTDVQKRYKALTTEEGRKTFLDSHLLQIVVLGLMRVQRATEQKGHLALGANPVGNVLVERLNSLTGHISDAKKAKGEYFMVPELSMDRTGLNPVGFRRFLALVSEQELTRLDVSGQAIFSQNAEEMGPVFSAFPRCASLKVVNIADTGLSDSGDAQSAVFQKVINALRKISRCESLMLSSAGEASSVSSLKNTIKRPENGVLLGQLFRESLSLQAFCGPEGMALEESVQGAYALDLGTMWCSASEENKDIIEKARACLFSSEYDSRVVEDAIRRARMPKR
jgi:hypothetical protein